MKPAKKCTSIDEVRKAIDMIDSQIIDLLTKRLEYVKEVVRFKEPNEQSVIAEERLEEVIRSRRKMAEKNGLNPEIIEKIYRELINYFISEEMKLLNLK